MRWTFATGTIIPVFALLVLSACSTDYDVTEVAPAEHLVTDEHAGHDHAPGEPCYETDIESEQPLTGEETTSIDEEREAAHAGHAHDEGDRNHGTQWFFNQPWAAPFIWGKLVRDSLVFLALAVGIFFATRKRSKR
ncbi:MAG: hypothetical protein KAH54_03340 [Candidatus Sabulitectum sp.]|nr:hypothetical protein [Candidatus Sabulitectum sp.]